MVILAPASFCATCAPKLLETEILAHVRLSRVDARGYYHEPNGESAVDLHEESVQHRMKHSKTSQGLCARCVD